MHRQIVFIVSQFLWFYDQFFFLVLLEHEKLARNIEIDGQFEFIGLGFHQVELDWSEKLSRGHFQYIGMMKNIEHIDLQKST